MQRHLKFECSILHSNVYFYLNLTNIRNSIFLTALILTVSFFLIPKILYLNVFITNGFIKSLSMMKEG